MRFRRYSEVLYALEGAARHQWGPLAKIQLQKVLFLTEMMGPFQQVIISHLDYRVWHRGPYSRDLQNAVDHLIACGLVKITNYSIGAASDTVPTRTNQVEYARYQLTDLGVKLIKELIDYEGNRDAQELVLLVCDLVDIYGLSNVVDLVYQEPTFAELKRAGRKGHSIVGPGVENQTLRLLAFIDDAAKHKMRFERFDWTSLALAFFETLWANFSRRQQEATWTPN